MASLVTSLLLGIASFRAYGFHGYSWRHPRNRLAMFKTFILSTATYGLNIIAWAPPVWKDALTPLFGSYHIALVRAAAIITGTKYPRYAKQGTQLLHFCGLLPAREFADYLGGCLGLHLDSMDSSNPLSPLIRPSWNCNRPALQFPYSIYAHLATMGGQTASHRALRRYSDQIRKGSKQRLSNKAIASIARRRYFYQLIRGKEADSDRCRPAHDSFSRCREHVPIRLCAMIATNTFMFKLLDHRTGGCLCPVCPDRPTFTTSHFACVTPLIRSILVGPKLPPIGPNLLTDLQIQHDYIGIWTLHEHLGHFLLHEDEDTYPHPPMDYRQMFPIPRLITLLKYYFQITVQTKSSRLLVPPNILPAVEHHQIRHSSVVWCGIGLPPLTLIRRIMKDNLILIGITLRYRSTNDDIHDLCEDPGPGPVKTELGAISTKMSWCSTQFPFAFCLHRPELQGRIDATTSSWYDTYLQEFLHPVFPSFSPEPLQRP